MPTCPKCHSTITQLTLEQTVFRRFSVNEDGDYEDLDTSPTLGAGEVISEAWRCEMCNEVLFTQTAPAEMFLGFRRGL